MSLVSVIIPAYNAEPFISETLDSVFAQSFQDFEVIVVDDSSSDRTPQIVRTYEPRVKYFVQDHKGPGAARNMGLRVSTAPLVAFLDADDVWLPSKLERQVDFARKHPEYGIIATEMAWFNESGILEQQAKKSLYSIANGFVMERLLLENWIAPSCAMVRKECFDTVGYFDEEKGVWGEDWMMWVRIAARYPVYFIDDSLAKVRVHASSYSRRDSEGQFRSLFRALEKLGNDVPQLAAKPALLKKAAFQFSIDRALDDLYRLDPDRAREKLKTAIKYKRYSPPAWILLAAANCPTSLLKSVRNVSRIIKRSLKR